MGVCIKNGEVRSVEFIKEVVFSVSFFNGLAETIKKSRQLWHM